MKIMRKWEYIAKRCEEEGLTQSAEIARKIDDILREEYDREYTSVWEADYDKLPTLSIEKIATDIGYCIACEEDVLACERCRFAERAGKCQDMDGLYRKFHDTLEDEKPEKRTCLAQSSI